MDEILRAEFLELNNQCTTRFLLDVAFCVSLQSKADYYTSKNE